MPNLTPPADNRPLLLSLLSGECLERDLVEAAIGGEVEAFGQLYKSCVSQVYRYIVYRVPLAPEAEDLTAQVFLSAWKAIGNYKSFNGKPFVAWLYTIAHNQVINYYINKKQTTRSTSIEEVIDLADLSLTNNPTIQLDRLADYAELRKAILKLPFDQQQVIYLRYVEELSHAEIGRLMGKPPATVRSILSRALEALRKALKPELILG